MGLVAGASLTLLAGIERPIPAEKGTIVRHPIVRLKTRALPIIVDVTVYDLEEGQTDGSPFVSRCGKIDPRGVEVAPGKFEPVAAVSQDLLDVADCGTRIRVGSSIWIVWDTMAPRWVRRIDLLRSSNPQVWRGMVGRRSTMRVL